MSMLEKALEKANKREKSAKEEGVRQQKAEIRKQDKLSYVERKSHSVKSDLTSSKIELTEVINKKNKVKFNWDYLKEQGFIQLDDSHNRIFEEFRTIKRPLVSNAQGSKKEEIKNSNLILITSSIPNEGKTFTAINLAFSIAAEMDKKVLLIDADVAKPSISKVLGIKSPIGLIDFLETDELSLSDIILETEMPGLRIIPAGKTHNLSTELLASDKMVALSQELSERYSDRIVIFDTPPLLATTQAEVLASQMGQIVLVVGAESTSQRFVMESVKKLQNCSDVVMTLLNKAQRNLTTGHYGYGYY